MKLTINKMGIIVTIIVLIIVSFTLYQSFQNGQHIAARAADRDRQFVQLLNNQTTIINQCKVSPRKPG